MSLKTLFSTLLLGFLLLGTGCRFQVADELHWEMQLLAPILQSEASLSQILRDTSRIQTDPDQFVRIVFRDTLVDFRLIDYVTVPDTTVQAQVSLDSISLSTDSLVQDITLADIARQLQAQGNFMGDSLLAWHGRNISFVPPFSGLSSGDVSIDASQFFEKATLLSGELQVTVLNRLPLEVKNVIYHLRNDGQLNDTLIRRTIPSILPNGGSVTDIADLSGKTIESSLAGKLENIDTEFGSSITIDTNDYIRLKIKVAHLKASQATAIFPSQTVIHDQYPVKYFFGEEIQLTKMEVGSGTIEVATLSSIQDTLQFIYALPSARKNGQKVKIESKLLPAPPNGQAQNYQSFDLSGYAIDLSLNGDSANLFPQVLTGNLIYSGNLVEMDLSDQISVSYGLQNIIPSYVEGYLGQQNLAFQDHLPLTWANGFEAGLLQLKAAKAELIFRNSVGMDGQLTVRQLTAVNGQTGQQVALQSTPLSQPIWIPGAKLPNIGQAVETRVQLDSRNSNILNFLGVLPTEIALDLAMQTNPQQTPSYRGNFATDQSAIQAFIDLEIPLEGIGDHIIIQDTQLLDLSAMAIPNGVEAGTLNLWVANQFPLEAKVQIYFLSDHNILVDSFFQAQPARIAAGILSPNGRVNTPTESQLSSRFDAQRLERLRDKAYKAIIRFDISTQPQQEPVKLYADYKIQLKLVGDFDYWVGR